MTTTRPDLSVDSRMPLPRRFPSPLGIALVAIAFTAVACASATGPTARPSGPIAIATSSPSASVSSVATPPAGAARTAPPDSEAAPPLGETLGLDTTAVTVTDGLRVRSLPEVSEASERLEPLLHRGQALYVTGGPVEGSGFRWYEVYAPGPDLGGWVAAAGKDGETWIERRPAECTLGASEDRFVDELGYWLMYLACYKDEVFGERRVLAAVQDDGLRCPDVVPYWFEPNWLNDPVSCSYEFYGPDTDTGHAEFVTGGVFHPGVRDNAARLLEAAPDPAAGVTVDVIGRLDHPDARNCRAVGEEPPSPVQTRLECRSVFVITAIELAE